VLSQTAEYALRTVLFIAQRPGDSPTKVDEIAAALTLPRNYLSKTLHRLAREGILSSARGKGGGFRLALPPSKLKVIRVVQLFDRIGDGRQCLLGRPACSDAQACDAHASWKAVSAQVANFFANTSVADLLAGHGSAPQR
jgi:Rrf2 family transcriptional regulator, iron-sulfur cluster assembly transcription factor